MAEYTNNKIDAVVANTSSAVSSTSSDESKKSDTGRWGEHMEAEPVNINGAYQEFEE